MAKIMIKDYRVLFFALYSILVFLLFYRSLSSNGLILGNDPAVHLSKAYEIIESGKVPLSEVTWYPPLYRVILAGILAFTNAASVENSILLMKILTVTFDLLLVMIVYLLGRRLLGEECGIIASSLMLLCFPFYEINFWGGYSSLLSMIYFFLLLLYLPSEGWDLHHKILVFLTTFSMVLTHQFTTFLAIMILAFYLIIAFVAFKASLRRSLMLAIFGVSIAFALWYLPIILPYFDIVINHVFFSSRQYLYLVGRVAPDTFMLHFGFILPLSIPGLFLAFPACKLRKETSFYALLLIGFIVPLLFTQSYYVGFMLPYDRFTYYLMPLATIFASVVFCFSVRFALLEGDVIRMSLGRLLKFALVILLIVLLATSRFPALTDKIAEALGYYSYMDSSGYQAGKWLSSSYPEKSAIVTTEKPGIFFGLVSNKYPFMETNPIIERSVLAETVLNLLYELEHPFTLFRVYEVPLPYELDQFNVLIHNVWKRVAFLYPEESMVFYVKNGENCSMKLSDFDRRIFWKNVDASNVLCIEYVGSDFALTEMVKMCEDRIPVNVTWQLSHISQAQITEVKVLLSIHLDLHWHFNMTYVPGLFYWENPWNFSQYRVAGRNWTTINFLPKDYVGFYDPVNGLFCAVKFVYLPFLGQVGVLSTGHVDAFRLTYVFDDIRGKPAFSYIVVAFSEESFMKATFENIEKNFDYSINLMVTSRDWLSYVRREQIGFLVFNRENFRRELAASGLLQVVYSNDYYVICKLRNNLLT